MKDQKQLFTLFALNIPDWFLLKLILYEDLQIDTVK